MRSQVQHRERADGAQEDAHDAGAVHLNTGSTVQVQNLRDDVRLTTRPLGAHKTSSSHVTYSPDFRVRGRKGVTGESFHDAPELSVLLEQQFDCWSDVSPHLILLQRMIVLPTVPQVDVHRRETMSQ